MLKICLVLNRYTLLVIVVVGIFSVGIGTVFGLDHINYDDPDWECKKTIEMWELAKSPPHYNEQLNKIIDYNHFINETKWLADKKCGFNVNNIIS